jgi:SAM-dependent methyltransferase
LKETRDWKAEAVRQWTASPCGATEESPFGSPEFFEAVRRERYENYAPWLPGGAEFAATRGKRVLEVGFGLGTDLTSFARAGACAFGVDLTPRHAFATRRRFLQSSMPFRLVLGDGEALPFREGSFDRVHTFGVLHHTPDLVAALAEIRRVLRPAGVCWIALYHRWSFFWLYWMIVEGMLKLGFPRHGVAKTMSRIEYRKGDEAVPLVRAYGRRDLRRLLHEFRELELSVHHFAFSQAGRVGRALGPALRPLEPAIARRWGWYVVAKAMR